MGMGFLDVGIRRFGGFLDFGDIGIFGCLDVGMSGWLDGAGIGCKVLFLQTQDKQPFEPENSGLTRNFNKPTKKNPNISESKNPEAKNPIP